MIKMSNPQEQIINEQGNTGKNVVDQLSFKDEVRAYEKGKSTVLWFNTATKDGIDKNTGMHVKGQHVYLGGNMTPTWGDPVVDMAKLQYNREQIKSAKSTDIYKVLQDPFIDDWQNIAREYADVKAARSGRNLRQASIGTEADFSAIDVINVMSEMVATELRTFVLEQALTVIGTPQLDLKVDTYTRFVAEQGVP
jgi:hypothetical protein